MVFTLDSARVLHRRMYDKDSVEELMSTIRQKAAYLDRRQSHYEQMFVMDVRKLQAQVRQTFHGFGSQRITPALQYFSAHLAFPCLQVHPEHTQASPDLKTLLDFLRDDPAVGQSDLKLITQIACGHLHRCEPQQSPASCVHGMFFFSWSGSVVVGLGCGCGPVTAPLRSNQLRPPRL